MGWKIEYSWLKNFNKKCLLVMLLVFCETLLGEFIYIMDKIHRIWSKICIKVFENKRLKGYFYGVLSEIK